MTNRRAKSTVVLTSADVSGFDGDAACSMQHAASIGLCGRMQGQVGPSWLEPSELTQQAQAS